MRLNKFTHLMCGFAISATTSLAADMDPSGIPARPSSPIRSIDPGIPGQLNPGRQPLNMERATTTDDAEISRKIRQSLANDTSLSAFARNIAIVTQNGSVILKGQVLSLDEKSRVEELANSVIGVKVVTNQVELREAH